ncbi:MAG: DUF1653 domain-containing protein [Patescibacteria group bacterium]
MKEIKKGQRYKHFKGKEYIILEIARDSETTEEVIVYQAQYDSPEFGNNQIWVRAKSDFCGTKEIGGEIVDRFSLIEE